MNLNFLDTPIKEVEVVESTDFKPARNYQVVLWNSDYAEFYCIINSLTNVFGFSSDKALQFAQTAHQNGSVVIGEWTKDVSETKVSIAQKYLAEAHINKGFEEPSNVYTSVPIE